MDLRTRVETLALRAVMTLPQRVQKALAGRPVVIDGQTLATDVQLMLRMQELARIPGSEELPVEEGREQMRRSARVVSGNQPIGAVRDLEVAGVPARHYLPSTMGTAPGPLLVYFHGGGFLHGDLDTHDGTCRVLAEQSGVPVLAIHYRRGPEAPFPAAFDDAEAVHRWVVEHAAELGADQQRIGVGGDSAGGNLAAWVAIAAARGAVPLAWQLLIYPCAQPARQTASSRLFAKGFYLTLDYMEKVDATYLPTELERKDERVDLMSADLPAGLAPAYLVTAGFDPLRDEGEAYARRLAEAGVDVELERFPGQIHGFINMVAAGPTSRAAADKVAEKLKAALG